MILGFSLFRSLCVSVLIPVENDQTDATCLLFHGAQDVSA